MKNMIVTVPSWELSSTLRIALHIWVSGESEWNILFIATWHRWNSPGLEAGLVLSLFKVCCFITQWEQRIEEQLLTLPCSSEPGTWAEEEVHTQVHLPALVSKSIYCATLHWKQNHSTLLCHQMSFTNLLRKVKSPLLLPAQSLTGLTSMC